MLIISHSQPLTVSRPGEMTEASRRLERFALPRCGVEYIHFSSTRIANGEPCAVWTERHSHYCAVNPCHNVTCAFFPDRAWHVPGSIACSCERKSVKTGGDILAIWRTNNHASAIYLVPHIVYFFVSGWNWNISARAEMHKVARKKQHYRDYT